MAETGHVYITHVRHPERSTFHLLHPFAMAAIFPLTSGDVVQGCQAVHIHRVSQFSRVWQVHHDVIVAVFSRQVCWCIPPRVPYVDVSAEPQQTLQHIEVAGPRDVVCRGDECVLVPRVTAVPCVRVGAIPQKDFEYFKPRWFRNLNKMTTFRLI